MKLYAILLRLVLLGALIFPYLGNFSSSASLAAPGDVAQSTAALSNNQPASDFTILLKSRQFVPRPDLTGGLSVLEKADTPALHMLVQLWSLPSEADKRTLAQAGIQLLSYIPHYAWLATVSEDVTQKDVIPEIVRWIGPLWPDDKVAESLLTGQIGDWAKSTGHASSLYLVVEFFKDVPLEQAAKVVKRLGGDVIDEVRSLNAVVAVLPESSVGSLLAEDSVQWVETVGLALGPTNDGARLNTHVDDVQAAPYDLRGAGVTALIYDAGMVDQAHPDFANRLTFSTEGAAPVEDHATHVAGTFGGSGSQSVAAGGTERQWRGMAPEARIISDDYDPGTSLVHPYLFYNNPGSIEEDYAEAVRSGADLANNSIGMNLCGNYVDTNGDGVAEHPERRALYGDYESTARLIDGVVSGHWAADEPFLLVFSAGNERAWTACNAWLDAEGHSTISTPATAKNALVVGAINSDSSTMTRFSSFGPVDDGRIKPEVVAPGCQSSGDNGVTSTVATGFIDELPPGNPDGIDDYNYPYDVMCGTSMATPVVTGISALLMQQYRATYGADPLPSTVKALLVNTARDLGTRGPDFGFGYGAVDAKAAVDAIQSQRVVTSAVSGRSVHFYALEVLANTQALTITVAWDDPPGTANAALALVNNLDVTLISPNNTTYYPWTLNAQRPEDSAVGNRADTLNPLEQISVYAADLGATSLPTGTWQIRILGTDMPEGPQSYSLVVSGGTFKFPAETLVDHYAPVWYQDTDDSDYTADYITRFDFDGNWRGNDNWQNYRSFPLAATIYYSVVETRSHLFLLYASFHARDWDETCIMQQFGSTDSLTPADLIPGDCHENDMEGVVLAIRKDAGMQFGELQLMAALAHNDWHAYTRDAMQFEAWQTVVNGRSQAVGSHPAVFVEAKGHALSAWDRSDFPGGDGIVYVPAKTAVEPSSGNAWPVDYALRPLDELWRRRYCTGENRTFRAGDDDFKLGTTFDANDWVLVTGPQAKPPWGWDEGKPFWDPVTFFKDHFSDEELGDGFSTEYIDNPYGAYADPVTRRANGTEIEKGLCFLSLQPQKGHWSNYVAITALDALAYLNAGYPESDPDVTAAIQYIRANVKPDGSIHNDGNRATYHTSLAVLPLKATRNPEYADELAKARDWLVSSQWDNASRFGSVNESSWYWGGFGYGNNTRPDLSNTQFALLALNAVDLPNPNPENTWQKAVRFVSRSQRWQQTNEGFTAGNDGGFVYYPGTSPAYGSMTGAGIWGLALAGLSPSDPRFAAALSWVENNYTWASNPGEGSTALYYYYLSMSKALSMARKTTVANHDWFADLKQKLNQSQQTDGSWINSNNSLMENNADLVTAYALLSLQTRTLPEDADLELSIILHSPADVHLFDALGRHVGKNYDTGQVELQIPGATYSSTDPQTIIVSQPQAGNYTVQLIGTADGPYTLDIVGTQEDQVVSSTSYNGIITQGGAQGTFLNVAAIEGALTIFSTTPEVLPQMVAEPTGLALTIRPGTSGQQGLTVHEIGGQRTVEDITVFSTNLVSDGGVSIPDTSVRFEPATFDLPAGQSQMVTMTIAVSSDIPPGRYQGQIVIESVNAGAKRIDLTVQRPHVAYAPVISNQPVRLTWQPGSGLANRAVYSFSSTDATCSTLFAATDNGAYRSTNGGQSWSPVLTGDQANRPQVAFDDVTAPSGVLTPWVAVCPANPNIVYLTQWGGGVYRSADGGATWQTRNGGLGDLWIYALEVSRTNCEVVVAATNEHGVWKTADGGVSWAPHNSGLGNQATRAIAIAPGNSNRLFVGTTGGVWRSEDGGNSWTPTAALPGAPVRALAVSPSDTARVFAGLQGAGVFSSANAGASWQEQNVGLSNRQAHALAINPRDAQTVIVGIDSGGGVYRSSNGGQTWSPLNDGLSNRDVKALWLDGGACRRLHVGTTNGAWYYGP